MDDSFDLTKAIAGVRALLGLDKDEPSAPPPDEPATEAADAPPLTAEFLRRAAASYAFLATNTVDGNILISDVDSRVQRANVYLDAADILRGIAKDMDRASA